MINSKLGPHQSKKSYLDGIVDLDFRNQGQHQTIWCRLYWKSQYLLNKKKKFGGKRSERGARKVDLANVIHCGIDHENRLISLKYRSKRRNNILGEYLNLNFDREDFYNWVYWLYISLAKHSDAEIDDKKLNIYEDDQKTLTLDPVGSRARGAIRAIRDKQKFKTSQHNKLFNRFTKMTNKERTQLPMGIVGGKANYVARKMIGQSGEAKAFASELDPKSYLCGLVGLDPSKLSAWSPDAVPVIVRCVNVDDYDMEDMLKKIVKETRLLASLEHNNVIKLIDVGYRKSHDGITLVTVLEKGTADLKDHIMEYRDSAPFTDKQKMEMAIGILHGINHMHKRNIYHFDIKPENVVLMPDLTPKLIDFGFAIDFTRDKFSHMKKIYITSKTVGYICPEDIEFAKNANPFYLPLPEKTDSDELIERFAKRDSYAAGMTLLDAFIAEFRKSKFLDLKKVNPLAKIDHWQKKIKERERRRGSNKASPMLKLARIAQEMIDPNYKSRLSIHDAKEKFKKRYTKLVERLERSERETANTQTLRRKVRELEVEEQRLSKRPTRRITLYRCRICKREYKYAPIKCDHCGSYRNTVDGPTFTKIN